MPSIDTKPSWVPQFASRIDKIKASEIRELLKLLDVPGVISFAGGIPDPKIFPKDTIKNIYSDLCADEIQFETALQYSLSEGDPDLRAWIAGHMAAQGVICTPENILITNGSQQGLEFLGKLFLSPADTALVEGPTYLGALQAFSANEPNYDTLRFGEGNRTAQSFTDLAKHKGGELKFAYVVPDFANPTGETLSLADRKRLLAQAMQLGIPVIEDSPYRMLRYSGKAIPSLLAIDCQGCGSIEDSRVINCGSFSKVFTPGLRVGWVCAAKPIIEKLTLIKQAGDLASSAMNQRVMFKLAQSRFEHQVAVGVEHYRAKRDAMLAALDAFMPNDVDWTRPDGGLFIWVTLPKDLDAAELLGPAVSDYRIAFVPGDAFFADGSGKNTLRLSFSLPTADKIADGIKKLGVLIRSKI